ncbi:MAG TPA: hypothetical protein VJN64_09890 [Terriglobales bacterium]|nr:hypothetical protein [Terriglobales bacterium]
MLLGQGAKVHPGLDASDADADNPIERGAWFSEGRQLRNGNPAALLQHAYEQKLQLRAITRLRSQYSTGFAPQSTAIGGWHNLGPWNLPSDPSGFQSYGAVTGRATAIAIDQNDASGNTVYAGGAYGGLWRSANAAAPAASVAWTPLLDGQPTLVVGAVALKPDTTGPNTVILVGTGETNSSGDSYYGLGILRSTGAGATWQLIDSAIDATSSPARVVSFKGLGFSKITFNTSPGKTSQVVAATASTNAAATGAGNNLERGLYYSNDAGLSWNFAFVSNDGANAIPYSSATDVVYDPVSGKFFAALRFQGVYSSSDGGQTWQRVPNQPGGSLLSTANCPAFGSIGCPLARGALAVRQGTGELYAAYVDANQNFRGIYRSTDQGASWSADLGQSGYTNCTDSLGCGSAQSAYNFYLSAVPSGTAGTDVYLGGVNVYRCSLSSSASAACNWMNLTHSYGCANTGVVSASSHVHPDQHGMTFLATNPRTMFFVNDGGVYRSLNGAASDGSCSAANAASWQNLNAGLGPMTEFIWMSHDESNPSLLLGGTQDNGSARGDGASWTSVNSGDGGFSDIDPRGNGIWYTAGTGVSIHRCTGGADCSARDFVPVIDNCNGPACHDNIGGDSSGFYTPYMLDPLDASKLIVGTCRIWRGPADGSGWPGANNGLALSFNLDTGSNTACAANHMITALAAGGPPSPRGAASVIYAGRNDGRIFVSTAAESGPQSFMDRSANLNSRGFKISGVAVDPSDPSGKTAVAAVMGFGVGHVWRTTDAGVTWTDISGSGAAALPDAPADSVVIDRINGSHVIAGTDVGVFETLDGGNTWSEVAAGLPSVPAVRLLLFDGPGTRRLRAATYGRGIWEAALPPVPFFQLQQSATGVTLNSVNGFTGTVSLGCSGSLGCSVSPSSITLGANASASLSVSIVGQSARQGPVPLKRSFPYIFALAFAGCFLRRSRTSKRALFLFLAIILVIGISSCGGGSNAVQIQGAAPQQTGATVVVTASSGTQSQSLAVTLSH